MTHTAKQILGELVEKAHNRRFASSLFIRSSSSYEQASEVGKLVESLSPEDREKLKELSAKDIEKHFECYGISLVLRSLL